MRLEFAQNLAGRELHSIFIGSNIYNRSSFCSKHPLAIPRVSLAIDLCRALGWINEDTYREAPLAGFEQLCRFHDEAYVRAVLDAERTQTVSVLTSQHFNLGVNGNPVHGEVFQRPATACGASLLAADLIREHRVIYNPAGGTHHGRRDRASGYCIFNDIALAILNLLDHGVGRIFYLDLDAHFGDGVQDAFADDDRVFTLSIHEAGRWPMSRDDPLGDGFGAARDRAGGSALNLPVPAGFNDSELTFLMENVVLPTALDFAAEVVIVQAGCDALADDPMTRLMLSNRALWEAIAQIDAIAPRLIVLGGGGYNPYAVGRCWAGVWATLCGFVIPKLLPQEASALLKGIRWMHRLGKTPPVRWLEVLADPPRQGPISEAVRALSRLCAG